MQRRVAALLDAPDGRRLGMGQGLSADFRRTQNAAVRIRQTQLLCHLRGGRRRYDPIAEGSRRGPYFDGDRLTALRLRITTHGLEQSRAKGSHPETKRKNLRRECGEADEIITTECGFGSSACRELLRPTGACFLSLRSTAD